MKTNWFRVSLVLILFVFVNVNAAEQSKSTSEWVGKWLYTEEQSKIPVTFTQNGDIVSGLYSYDSPKFKANGKIEGNLSNDGKVLSGIWTEKGEYTYSAEQMASMKSGSETTTHTNFTPSADGNTTLGTWDETGAFNFTLSDDGTFWNGTFIYASDNPPIKYNWNGTKTE